MRLKKIYTIFSRTKGMESNSYPINNPPPSGALFTLPKPTRQKAAQQSYYDVAKQDSSIKGENLPYVNNWVSYRLFDQYLRTLITAMDRKLDLSEDTKQAFIFNAERATDSYQNLENWVYFGGIILDEMQELSFEECIEMIKHMGHQKSKKMKLQIIETGMIKTLKDKQDDFDSMYRHIVEKAIAVIDLIDTYEIDLENFVVTDDTNAQFNEILKKMSIEHLEIETGDRLDIEKCRTIEVCMTDDITKELSIKEIVQKGIKVNGEVYRKTSVIVYRLEEGLDD